MNTREPEPGLKLLLGNVEARVNAVLSNSFGFGGNNCSVVFARA